MSTSQIPQPVLVKAEFARAQGQPGTTVVDEEWSEKRISADHPSQAQGFGIGNVLTAGTSDGDDTTDQDSNSGSNTSESTATEPWTLVTGKKQGRQHKLGADQEERESTDLPDDGGATRDKDKDRQAAAPLSTYNQVTLGLRGEEEAKSTDMRPSKKYFSKDAPTGSTCAECLVKARPPPRSHKGSQINGKKERI